MPAAAADHLATARGHPRAADGGVLAMGSALAGAAAAQLVAPGAAAVTYAPGVLALHADAAGLHLVAALLLGSAGVLLAARASGAAAADRTSTSVVGVLGTALVVLGACAAHDGDALVWWQRAVVAEGLAGAALAGIHLSRKRST